MLCPLNALSAACNLKEPCGAQEMPYFEKVFSFFTVLFALSGLVGKFFVSSSELTSELQLLLPCSSLQLLSASKVVTTMRLSLRPSGTVHLDGRHSRLLSVLFASHLKNWTYRMPKAAEKKDEENPGGEGGSSGEEEVFCQVIFQTKSHSLSLVH